VCASTCRGRDCELPLGRFGVLPQAAAYSGAEDEERNADRIARQEQELAKLIELREALLRK
jgi:hypothetical protein